MVEQGVPKQFNPAIKRWAFPVVNGIALMMLFGVIGYYVFDVWRWLLGGFAAGLAVGAAFEFGLGAIGGWVYRRRVLMVVFIETVLIVTVGGPFAVTFVSTVPHKYPVCCIEDSGLGPNAEWVQIPVADGETLVGWYAPPLENGGAVVLVLHGSQGDRRGGLIHAQVLHQAGYGVLVYDQRASGESSGNRQSMGLYDQHDIGPIIDWLTQRPEVDANRIGGVGISLGGHILIMAAPNEPRLRAIWSDGISINSIEDVPDDYTGVSNSFIRFINQQAFWISEWYLGEEFVPFTQLIPQIAPRHLMLVAGGLNPYETDFNRNYEPLLGEHGELWVIENASHVAGIYVEPELYSARMLAFFEAALGE